MANTLYPKGKEKILSGGINYAADTLRAVLVSNAYAYSTNHEFLSDLGANVLGEAKDLTSKTVTSGVFDADDLTFAALVAGSTVKAIVIYKDTGVAGTSPLLHYLDTVTGLPLVTTGADIKIQWDSGTNKIFALA